MKLSENLKKIRKENSLSQEEFAEELNVSRQSVSKWESGQSYPEMEKMLIICKKYNYTLDELLNGKVDFKNENKISIKKAITNCMDWITNIINLFLKMNFFSKVKFLIEQCILIIIFGYIFFIVPHIFEIIFFEIISSDITLFSILGSALTSLFKIYILIFIIYIYYYLLDSRYVKYVTFVKEEKIIKTEKPKESKIIIRDSKDSEFSLINLLATIIIFLIKFSLAFVLLFLILFLITLIVLLVISMPIITNFLLFISLCLILVGFIVVSIFYIKAIYSFIFNLKVNKKLLLNVSLASVILISIGIGMFIFSIMNLEVIENNYDFTENISFEINNIEEVNSIYLCNARNISYEIVDSESILVDINYPEYLNLSVYNHSYYRDNILEVFSYVDFMDASYIFTSVYEDIKNNKINTYENTYDVVIYANEDNAEAIDNLMACKSVY